MPTDSKTWGIVAAALLIGVGLGVVLKPILKPCGCNE